MAGHCRVNTPCGSTRFKDAFREMQKRLTLEGSIVISAGLFERAGDNPFRTAGTGEMPDDMYKHKTDVSEEIYVINVGGYIGSSTRSETQHAQAAVKELTIWNQKLLSIRLR